MSGRWHARAPLSSPAHVEPTRETRDWTANFVGVLKTIADILIHKLEHHPLRQTTGATG